MKRLYFIIALYLPFLVLSFLGENTGFRITIDLLLVAALVGSILSLNSRSLIQQTLKFILVIFYLLLLFFSFLETMIYRFAGHGFNDEVFYHVGWESFHIGVAEFGYHLMALAIFMLLIIAVIFYFSRHVKSLHIWQFTAGLILLLVLSFYTSAGRFSAGWFAFNKDYSELLAIDKDVLNALSENGYINSQKVLSKQLISAEAPVKKNLILIYLESFNQFFLDTPPFNKLTPNIQALSNRYQSFEHQNSAYVTIEGIVSSMCGTLLSMRSGNDSFMAGSGYLSNLPCLGDVLNRAGYEQYFLGGAMIEFAGKGDFLLSHGYDHAWGMKHWYKQGLRSKNSFWGLSDVDLFNEALKTIEAADKKEQPYNLTLINLGTHKPGFIYRDCEPLKESEEQFLAAVKCTDLLLSKFINELERKQLLDDTLLVVVADHGIFPNPTMKSVFGDLVYDRRLVGMTNYPDKIAHQPLASYDLAPSILDWLGINHNVQFLFGQSAEEPRHAKHKHLTRYKDWVSGQLVKNSHYACGEQLESGLLSKCDKENVINWMHWSQSQFTQEREKSVIDCKINLKVELNDQVKEVSINNHNYYYDFYYDGYFMTTRKYKKGWFLFHMDEQMHLQKLSYLPLEENSEKAIAKYKQETSDGFNIYVKVQGKDAPAVIKYSDGNGWHQSEKAPGAELALDFCPK